jgi:2-methylcitrate dehydratase
MGFRTTADHSMPFTLAVALIDGEVWYQAFSPDRILNDMAVRQLMQKIIVEENPSFALRQSRLTVRKKSDAQLVKDAIEAKPMSVEEVHAMFDRICAGVVPNDVRDRARAA